MWTVIVDAMFMVYVIPDQEIDTATRIVLEKSHNFTDRASVYQIARRCLQSWQGYLQDFTAPIHGPVTAIYRIPTMIAHSRLEQWVD